MSIKGNPKSCPQNLSSIGTQTSNTDEKVLEGKEVSGDSSESYIVDLSESNIGEKEEDDDDPFFTCFGEMSDKDFHCMMNANDLTYSTLFCVKVFGSAFGSHASLESCNVMGEYARHGEGPLVTSIQSAREKGIPYYESSSDEEDEDDDLYMGRSMYSNTGHFRNIAFNTNSVTDLIHCMDGYESYLEDFYDDSDSDSEYFWQMKVLKNPRTSPVKVFQMVLKVW